MNLSNPEELKSLLRISGLRLKDYLGQNFLVDEQALGAIIEAADLESSDTVLEVGPGLGVLTAELLKKAGQVIAVEKDERLFLFLKHRFLSSRPTSKSLDKAGVEGSLSERDSAKLQLFNQDILRFHLQKNIPGEYKVIANIPYYLTSKLFQIFLESTHPPKLLVLMVQKEVGERVVAKPGELSILGISVQVYADAEIVRVVPKDSFWPVPKIDSVILKITPKNKYPEITDKKAFFRIIKMAFAGKRKQIKNTLKNLDALKQAGVNPTARPQDLRIEDWIKLYQVIANKV